MLLDILLFVIVYLFRQLKCVSYVHCIGTHFHGSATASKICIVYLSWDYLNYE